jgi:hypothetical protein
MRPNVLLAVAVAGVSILASGCSDSVSAAAKEAEARDREAVALRQAESLNPKFISVPSGASLTVRLNQSLSTTSNRPGEHFSATLVEPVMVSGQIAIPSGTEVKGVIDQSFASGRLKGRAGMTLSLQEIELPGGEVAISTSTKSSVSGRHRKRNWAWIGGGAGTGAAIGAIAGGPPGAAIGAGSGAAAGLVTAAFTGKKQVRLPAETKLSFRLSKGLDIPLAYAPAADSRPNSVK